MANKGRIFVLCCGIIAIPFLFSAILTGCGAPPSPTLPPADTPVPKPSFTPSPAPSPTDTPAPPAIAVTQMPPEPDVVAGQEIAFVVKTGDEGVEFRWTAHKGTVSPSEGPAIIYTAPDVQGKDIVELEAHGKGGTTTEQFIFNIIPRPTDTPTSMPILPLTTTATPSPTPTPKITPTPTFTPKPTLTPAPTPYAFVGKVCQIESGSDPSTVFLRRREFVELGLEEGTKVTMTICGTKKCDIKKTFTNVTVGLDTAMTTCVARLSLPYREAFGIAGDTEISPISSRPDRYFEIVRTSATKRRSAEFQGQVCKIESEQDPNTVYLRLAEFNDLGILKGTVVSVTFDTGRTVTDVLLDLDSEITACAVRMSGSLRQALGVDQDTELDIEVRPIRSFSIRW